MKRVSIAILMVAWAGAAVHAAFEETNAMYWWTNAPGSNRDTHGNTWTVYSANGNPNPQLETTAWDKWILLSYDTANSCWGGRPGYNSSKVLMADGYYNAPGLTFEAGKSGSYSWQGKVSVPAYNAATLTFGKIVNGVWSALGSDIVVPLFGTVDLSTVGALQNISLGIGDKLTLYLWKNGGWTNCRMNNISIGYGANPVPFWTGTDGSSAGNPYTDEIGYQWGVYHTMGNANPQFGTGSAWTPLPYHSIPNVWGNLNEGEYRPGFTSGKTFQATGYYNAPGLVIRVPAAGTYCWKGSLSVPAYNAATLTFGKIVNGVWSSLGSDIVVPLYGTCNLSTVGALQNISLGTGDKLTLYLRKSGGWTNVTMDTVGIGGQIPESPGSTTYYVDSVNGDDQNNGTSSSTPWGSLAAVNAMRFAPGDRILFKAGTQYTGHLSPRGSGTAELPIVIDKYGTGNKPRIDGQGRGSSVSLCNVEYWEVGNLEITNQGDVRNPWIYGVLVGLTDFGTAHHIHLTNLYIHDIYSSNIKSEGGNGIIWSNTETRIMSRFDGLLIENCHLVRTDRNGIGGSGGYTSRDNWYPNLNVVIRGNLLEDIGGDGIVPTGTDGCVVEYNVIRGARTRALDYAAGIWPYGADNTIIQFNEVSGIKGTNDGQAFDSDGNCQNSLFQYNYSHDNEGGFFLICNYSTTPYPASIGNIGTIIRYNISQNDGGTYFEPIFDFNGNPQDVQVYNNTIYLARYVQAPVVNTWEWVGGLPANVQFSNNIFYADGIGDFVLSGDGYTFSNNVYYGSFTNRPSDSGAMTADPRLIAVNSGADGIMSLTGYGLAAGSPCISAGAAVANNGGADFLGAPISSPPSIGAYQYGTPIVETANWITSITNTTAQCGGQITNQGASSVTARGVCWGTSPLPTLADNYTQNGTGTGTYSSSMTGLTPSTTYYVRAYATNGSGTRYGHQLKFTTLPAYPSPTVPRVVTSSMTNITETSASCGGTVLEDGQSSVTTRGVCWSATSTTPTINDTAISSGSGTGSFTAPLTGLSSNTTYYLRAYAANARGTAYGDTIVFKTKVVLLSDGFESSFANWTTDWSRDTGKKHSGSYSAMCNYVENDLTGAAMDTQSFDTLDVEFWFYNQGASSSDNVNLQFYNGSGYVTLANLSALSPQNTWNYYKVSLTHRGIYAQYFNSSFRIKFTGAGIDFLEYFWIDDVKITGGYNSRILPGEQAQPPVNIPGDANGDGKVDVSDLGILAANYGMTAGATWALGDFSGDGKVDVSDLGILAANYGSGTGATLDFNTDAKTLGLTVDSEDIAKADTSSVSALGCGSAGLPLIAGLLLAGFLLGKLDD